MPDDLALGLTYDDNVCTLCLHVHEQIPRSRSGFTSGEVEWGDTEQKLKATFQWAHHLTWVNHEGDRLTSDGDPRFLVYSIVMLKV